MYEKDKEIKLCKKYFLYNFKINHKNWNVYDIFNDNEFQKMQKDQKNIMIIYVNLKTIKQQQKKMSIENHQQIKGISDCSRGDIDTKEILEEDIYLFLKI